MLWGYSHLQLRVRPSVGRTQLKRKHFVRLTALLAAAVLLAALLGCKSQVSGDVMATVDGRKIFRSDVDKYYDNQVASAQQRPAGEQATILRLNILRQLIDDEMVMRRAEKLGLLATEEEVDRKLNEIKSPYTQQEFDKRLQEKKITLTDFKRDIRRSITVDKVMNKEVSSKINVTEQDITDYFTAHKSEFNLIEPQYHLAQLFVTPTPNPQVHNQNNKAQNEGDARKKIQMIANRLDSGDDFATLAMNYSEDPETSNNGGDLGLAPESALKNADPVTRDSVLKLKAGQYTPVLPLLNPANHQPNGYMLVKLVSKEAAGQRDVSNPSVQQAFRQQLRDRREQLLKAAYYETLRDDAKITNYYAEEVLKNAGSAK